MREVAYFSLINTKRASPTPANISMWELISDSGEGALVSFIVAAKADFLCDWS